MVIERDSVEAPEQLEDQTDVPPLPAPPRPLNPRARRRSWQELSVRIWSVLAVVLALITLYFTVATALQGRQLRWLLAHGQLIHADVYEINGTQERRITFKRSDPLRVWVKFALPGHPDVVGERMLAQLPDPKATIRVGEKLDIRVKTDDIQPLNPIEKPGIMLANTWTDRTVAPPWHVQYTVVLLLVPLLLMVSAIAWWQRSRVLGIWRDGAAAAARVIGHRHTAVAPRSRIVRFTLQDGSGDRRVWTALHPAHDLPAVGSLIWIVHAVDHPGRAIVARLYE
jgi:hypothetical protein